MPAGRARVEIGNALRQLPGGDRLLQEEAGAALVAHYSRPPLVDPIPGALDAERTAVRAGAPPRELPLLVAVVEAQAAALAAPRLRRVLNASGVILHTNLGRAPLSPA